MKRDYRFFIVTIIWAVFVILVLTTKSPAESFDTPVFPVESEAPAITLEAEPEPEPQSEPSPEPSAEPEPEPQSVVICEFEHEMLATVIYQEAGGDACCDECRRRVADVVLNRVADERFPDTIEEVLTAERQYGRFHWTGIVWPERAQNPGEAHAVERAYRIAEEVLSGQHSELYGTGYIWQAEHEQGTDIIECCGTYFGR